MKGEALVQAWTCSCLKALEGLDMPEFNCRLGDAELTIRQLYQRCRRSGSGSTGSGSGSGIVDPVSCCEAMQPSCWACEADMTEDEYCEMYPDKCRPGSGSGSTGSGSGSTGSGSGSGDDTMLCYPPNHEACPRSTPTPGGSCSIEAGVRCGYDCRANSLGPISSTSVW